MNTRPILDDSAGEVALSASLNHDASSFAVALESGFRGRLPYMSECVWGMV